MEKEKESEKAQQRKKSGDGLWEREAGGAEKKRPRERDETSVGEGPAGQSTPASQKRASESSKDEQRPPRVHDGC